MCVENGVVHRQLIQVLESCTLHNGSKLPSIPIAHSAYHKEDYDSVKMLLKAVQYKKYEWKVIGDFKMVAFSMGMQGGFTKYSCHLSLGQPGHGLTLP